jgi:penicillin-binding protein 2
MLTPTMFADRRSVQLRLLAVRVLVIVVFAALAIAFWVLQVVQTDKFRDMAENENLKTIPLRAPRGVLYDRDGHPIVENTYSFTISIVRELTRDLNGAVSRVAAATGEDEHAIADIVRRHRADPAFRPIPVIEHATFAQVAAVTARRLELPEVVVQEVPTRKYMESGAAHLFGYVSEIQTSQLNQSPYEGLALGAIVGQSGVEKTYNHYLMGTDGNRNVVVNSVGREIKELKDDEPVDGDRLQLTIDMDLQRALEDAYRANNFAGASVLLDPRTGDVLALTSQPEFDPNDFANGVDRAEWNRLSNDPLKPLRDRLVQDRYSPGSTFKIVVATAALAEGIITPDTKFNCTGTTTFYGRVYQCDKKEAHGLLDLREAIEKSCDIYFYNVADRLKIDQIYEYAQKLGLVGKTGIDLPNEIESIIPSTAWKMKTSGDRWYAGETISVGIGQGPVTVTPIGLATMIATFANGGTVVTPHVVKAVDDGSGWHPLDPAPPRSIFQIPAEVRDPIVDGLWRVVNGDGTGSRARVAGHDVVGKTGTAQVISLEGAKAARAAGKAAADLRDHGWFVFFAPKDNPTIAGVVFAEHAGYGGSTVAPVARYALETYFAKKEGRPLPAIHMDSDGTMEILTGAAAEAERASKAAAQAAAVTQLVAAGAAGAPGASTAGAAKKSGGR